MKRCLVLLALAGCASGEATIAPVPPPVVAEASVHPHLTAVSDVEVPVQWDGPTDDELALGNARRRKRMDVDQLDASLREVLGIGWTEVRDGVEVELIPELARTLGRPDYIMSTDENLEASPIFAKFLGDAASAVCAKRVSLDRDAYFDHERVVISGVGLEDTSLTNPDGVDANLQRLRLRSHGREMAAGSPELVRWRWLFDTATERQGPIAGWQTVCVALVTHADFYTY